ncbi:2-hydroxy-3-oxopropionate reductase [archaeon HR01]|nr:2-hydroxy-3-oxopropionate reductase [archaeon HR01]
MDRVGFVGLGLMGKPMAKRVLSHGYGLTVFNRSRGPVEELARLGAYPASSLKEVAEKSDVVITMLPDEPDVRQVVLSLGEALGQGSVVVDMSTISPFTVRELHDFLSERGVEMLDAPVSGSTMAAESGTLTIMVGGSRDVFERVLPVLRTMGRTISYMGGAGMGAFTKLCNQVLVSVNLLATCEALLLASKAGLDLGKVIEVVGSGAAGSWQLSNLGPRMVARDFRPGFKVQHLRKDLRILRSVAERMGLPLLGTSLVAELVKVLDERGRGLEGTQALITVLEELAGHRIS